MSANFPARRLSARLAITLLLAGLLLPLGALGIEVPYLSGRVTDDAEVLSPAARGEITAILKAHESRTTNQVAVLTVRSLGGASVEDYATAVFQAWKLGRKGKDNGVLLLVAPTERRLRIEVGYGLEGTLPDVVAGRIIRNVITPRFKSGDFAGGISEGVRAIVAQLEGTAPAAEEAPPQPIAQVPEKKSLGGIDAPDLPLAERILFGGFIFGILGLFTVLGVTVPQMGWFLYFFLIPFWAMFPIVVLGVQGTLYLFFTYLVGFPVAKLVVSRTGWYQKARTDLKTKGRANVGGFVVSSGGSSGGRSGGSSGGGFSGGGGSSGGGGASGSW
jgi:uncharacterized protein